MKCLVLDTNIVSTLLKVRSFKHLYTTFPAYSLVITPAVANELDRAGFHDVPAIIETLTSDELSIQTRISEKRKSLGKGELECIAISLHRNWPLLTNDRKAQNVALSEGVPCWNLSELLRAMYLKKSVSKKELQKIIEDIEEKDNVLFKNKERILEDAK